MALNDLFVNANHIGARDGYFEPQRPNNGLLMIYGLEGFGGSAVKGPVANVLTLSIQSFPIPKQGNDVISVPFQNSDRKFAGRRVLEGFELVLTDYVDQPTAAVCLNWRNAVFDPRTERVGLARDYKKAAEVILYAPDGRGQRRYVLEGVWPSRFDPGEVDHTANGKMDITLALEVDKVYPKPGTWGVPITTPLDSTLGQLGNIAQNVLGAVLNR